MIRQMISATTIAMALLVSQPVEAKHHRSHGTPVPEVSVTVSGGPGRFEFVADGHAFKTRDHAERYLLYRVALFARKRGIESFALLHLPGERPGTHPAKADSSLATFSHWQPHWSYRLRGQGWQPWYPEWGDSFWADRVERRSVERFQLHAMVEMGGRVPFADPEAVFRTGDVLAELSASFRGSRS